MRLGVIAKSEVSLTGALADRQRDAQEQSRKACDAIDRMTPEGTPF